MTADEFQNLVNEAFGFEKWKREQDGSLPPLRDRTLAEWCTFIRGYHDFASEQKEKHEAG